MYVLGLTSEGVIVWDEKEDQELFRITQEMVFSMKRVMTTNSYLIKTKEQGVKILTIEDLMS
jgi:flavorubredoxin